MATLTHRSLIGIILILGTANSGDTLARQVKQSDQKYLEAKTKRFLDYQKDFFAFSSADATRGAIIPYALGDTARMVTERIVATRGFLAIHNLLTTRADHSADDLSRTVVQETLAYYVDRLNEEIETVNWGLANTKSPAVRALSTQMKEDLREIKTFFESLRPN